MKKLYLFAALAAMLAACSENDLTQSSQSPTQEAEDGAVLFDVYAKRGLTRAGEPGAISTTVLKSMKGFGVFGFYTDNTDYSPYATPNFMYNQQVKWDGSSWSYSPLKYWPNEFGTTAISDDVDKVTFFAYAPWVDVAPTTGTPTSNKDTNITQLTKNTATGDPIIKYVVDTDYNTSVDLLWGVVNEVTDYVPVGGTTAAPTLTAGMPFIDMVKENTANKIKFKFNHALAQLNVQVDAFVDGTNNTQALDSKTRIYVRSITLGGFAMKGALNLNNTERDVPLWLEYDGAKELTANAVTFYDGRKDGKEATQNGEQKSEKPATLNPVLVEDENTYSNGSFGGSAMAGVTNTPVNLFTTATSEDKDGFLYVIPTGEQMDVVIVYDVETIDPSLPGYLADGVTHGSSVENRIYKENVFIGNIKPGYSYKLKLHLGMTSVKFDAEVTPWQTTDEKDVDLPHNDNPLFAAGSSASLIIPAAGVENAKFKITGLTSGKAKAVTKDETVVTAATPATPDASVTEQEITYTVAPNTSVKAKKETTAGWIKLTETDTPENIVTTIIINQLAAPLAATYTQPGTGATAINVASSATGVGWDYADFVTTGKGSISITKITAAGVTTPLAYEAAHASANTFSIADAGSGNGTISLSEATVLGDVYVINIKMYDAEVQTLYIAIGDVEANGTLAIGNVAYSASEQQTDPHYIYGLTPGSSVSAGITGAAADLGCTVTLSDTTVPASGMVAVTITIPTNGTSSDAAGVVRVNETGKAVTSTTITFTAQTNNP